MAKLLFIGTYATDDPTKAALPLVGAVGAKNAGIECTVALIGEGASLMRDVIANAVYPVGFPPYKELLGQVTEAKIPIYV